MKKQKKCKSSEKCENEKNQKNEWKKCIFMKPTALVKVKGQEVM